MILFIVEYFYANYITFFEVEKYEFINSNNFFFFTLTTMYSLLIAIFYSTNLLIALMVNIMNPFDN